MYGEVAVNWERRERKLYINVIIPTGTEAEIVFPVVDESCVYEYSVSEESS